MQLRPRGSLMPSFAGARRDDQSSMIPLLFFQVLQVVVQSFVSLVPEAPISTGCILALTLNSRSGQAEIDNAISSQPNSLSRRSRNRRSGSCCARLSARS
jgi:hypothetical protein